MGERNETPQTETPQTETPQTTTPQNEIPQETAAAETGAPTPEMARSQRWEAQKAKDRAELEARYKDAPFLTRIFALYLGKPLVILSVLVAVGVLVYAGINLVRSYQEKQANQEDQQPEFAEEDFNQPLSEEDKHLIYEASPIDEEGAARIDAIAPVKADDTWTICVYMVGSNLEDMDENDLSYVTDTMIADQREQTKSEYEKALRRNVQRYSEELAGSGLDLPSFFFYPKKPVAYSFPVTKEVVVAEEPGAGSLDIEEMTAETWSDNIQIVIQTGGAKRWSNQMINPNRTQRFLYKSGQFSRVADLPLQPSYEPQTLADFLTFCKDEYPADHTMLVLWNHGGGPFGYGNDSIYGGDFSLAEIRQALESVYDPGSADKAFDIIGFDACLMSSLEVTHALDGFADYYALSEENEPGPGWDYTPWLTAMTNDPTMSPAAVARAIADSYTDYYMVSNVNLQNAGTPYSHNVTFSVLDAVKAHELYAAYSDLAKAQLKDAVADNSVLSEIGRCGIRATRYASDYSNVFNTVDLGGYVDYMSTYYPEECSRVKKLIGETVLYHRQNGGLSDSQGIAVYLPVNVNELDGLVYFLDYVYNISDDDNITALYYYKQAGCLPNVLKEKVKEIADVEPLTLNTKVFESFGKSEPVVTDTGFSIPVSQELQDLLVDYDLEVNLFDKEQNLLVNYGRDDYMYLDGEGHMVSGFEGTWIYLDGVPLEVEIISSTDTATDYRARVKYNDILSYLTFSCDNDTDVFSVTGIREIPSFGGDVNYMYNTKSNKKVEVGSKIVPVYRVTDIEANSAQDVDGEEITFSEKSGITREVLGDGYYIMSARISDQRGDIYYAPVIGATVTDGKVTKWKLNPYFYGTPY